MNATPNEIATYLKILEETPHRIRAACEGHPAEALQTRPNRESWSANEVVAHLRACVDVWGKDIRRMLTEQNPTWRHLSPRTWMRKTNYAEQSFSESFAIFVKEREDLLKLLIELPLADWSRSANVIQRGKDRKQTVFLRVRQMAMHEEGHMEQIEALMKQ